MVVGSAEATFGQALAGSRAQQTRTFELRASFYLARLYHDTGREREARAILAPALAAGLAQRNENLSFPFAYAK